MSTSLNIVNTGVISEVDKREIDEQIDQIIAKHKDNRYEINKLVFESVSALTASENYSNELASRGIVKRFWGGITGKNKQLQSKVDSSLAAAQYASQQTLQKLAEQNLMSFELIAAVNNKLNSSMLAVENEINNIYGMLVTFFKKTKSDIVQLESRVERLERNVNLLIWLNSIEYQMWKGVEYSELDDVSKIVCLARDFHEITKGKWITSDLLLLKSAMSDIGILPGGSIQYRYFITRILQDKDLFDKLFMDMDLSSIEQYPEYVSISAGIQKGILLESDESYIVDNSVQLAQAYGCEVTNESVKYNLIELYARNKGQISLEAEVNIFDFILELLYNLEQIKEIHYVKNLDEKMKEAKLLFFAYETEQLLPLLRELVTYGYVEAKYLLALLYETGCADLEQSEEKFADLIWECVEEHYLPSYVKYVLWLEEEANDEDKRMVIESINDLKIMARNDELASYGYALYFVLIMSGLGVVTTIMKLLLSILTRLHWSIDITLWHVDMIQDKVLIKIIKNL